MSYLIDFSDPLKATFTVNTGDYDGPGGNTANSSLRLYGRNALEWGEAVNENQLRMTEHWAGATPPPQPIEGQIWYEQRLYVLQTSAAWWRWNFTTEVWENVTTGVFGGIVGSNTPPLTPSDGDYWYTSNAPMFGLEPFTLYRYDTQYRQVPSTWLKRVYTISSSNPNTPPVRPVSQLKIWDGSGEWKLSTNIFPSTAAPLDPNVGDLWYDISGAPINVLRVWSGITWEAVNEDLYDQKYVNITGDTMTGNLSMGGNKITDVGTPTNPNDVVSLNFADTTYVNVSGDTMSGTLNMGNNFITNLLDPINNQDAATKQYVDTATAAATIFPTGMVIEYMGTTAPSGWLFANGASIGNTGSGATHTGPALQALYNLCWALPADTCVVPGGRGANAASDWAALKTITLPNFGQRVSIGTNSAAGHFDDFTNTAVNTSNERITLPSNNERWITGMAVVFSVLSGTAPAPLVNNTVYFIIRISATEIQLATTLANAQNGTPINLTTTGSGTFRISHTPPGTRPLGQMGGETEHAMNINELLAHTHTSAQMFTGFNVNANPGVQVGVGNTGTTGANNYMNNMQPYIVVNKLIKI